MHVSKDNIKIEQNKGRGHCEVSEKIVLISIKSKIWEKQLTQFIGKYLEICTLLLVFNFIYLFVCTISLTETVLFPSQLISRYKTKDKSTL